MKIKKIEIGKELKTRKDVLPDVDLDFESAGRDKIKEYLEEKYGRNNVCSLGTYGRLQLRSAIKDFAKLKNLSFNFVNEITRNIYGNDWDDLQEAIVKNDKVKDFVKEYEDIMQYIKRGLGNVRHSSIHAAGVLISPSIKTIKKNGIEKNIKAHLNDFVPVRKIKIGDKYELISQWEGEYAERRGLLKLDILGIRQLDIFKYIFKLVSRNKKIELDLDKIPLNDKNVFKKFKVGDTEGVFQFKSNTQKSYQLKLQPDNIEHLIASNALIRPGAMIGHAHEDYIKIKDGDKDPEYDIGLQEVTESTYGLYIYQEQIMKAMVVGGGLSLAESDEIRTYIKKFDRENMKKFEKKFIAGMMLKHNVKKEVAKAVWDKLLAFSGYGFNRSHSASYAIIGYWCQYLKTYYPKEFWIANLQYASEDDRAKYINRIYNSYRNIINIIFPDINKSYVNFNMDKNDNIVWALGQIKGIGQKAAENIISSRSGKKFLSLEDFYNRVERRVVNKRVFYSLIFAGAFDSFYNIKNAEDRFQIYEEYFKIKKETFEEKKLDNDYYKTEFERLLGVSIIEWFEILSSKKVFKDGGFDIVDYCELQNLNSAVNGRPIWVAGQVVGYSKRETKKGQPYYNITLEQDSFKTSIKIWKEFAEDEKFMKKLQQGKRVSIYVMKSDYMGTPQGNSFNGTVAINL